MLLPHNNPRILVVEDDESLGQQIVDQLGRAGFAPTWWKAGKDIEPEDTEGLCLAIFDLMLPGTYGMDMLKQLRQFSEIPVLILSARNDTEDKVRALKLGADDYLTKPFWPEELVERVRARLRRPSMQNDATRFEAGGIHIDLDAHTVAMRGKFIDLTRVEFDLLAALARRAGAAVTRQWLAENVLDPEREGNERTLDVHLSRLRRKLGENQPIETVWGIGYRFRGDES